MRFSYLKPGGKTVQHYLHAFARARGCTDEAELDVFLNPLPPIHNHISLLPEYQKASARLKQALKNSERIVCVGDWDNDGLMSLVQVNDLITAAGHEEFHWFVPDRRSEDYGLTMQAVSRCYEALRPQLIIAVDCGSPSHDSIQWLKERGADTIVIDHHQLGLNGAQHPAVAHLNPKAYDSDLPEVIELREMSASGLCYLFADQFVEEMGITQWDRVRALILGGVGTVVDVMKLVGVNRALAKWALHLASQPEKLAHVPGLVALNVVAGGADPGTSTFGFVWGPRVNATGRLEEATAAVRLLLSKTVAEAQPWAEYCHNSNEERRAIQKEILDGAMTQAASAMSNLSAEKNRVLVLFDQDWHHGVVGIVASRIKEQFSRPTIVLGWHEEGFCKGSGRSIPAYDMGAAIHAAAREGVILGGGGHHMAAGLKANLAQVDSLREWLNENCALADEDFIPNVELLGRCDSLTEAEWCEVFDRLEPFGNGNPRPALYLPGARLFWGPNELTTKEGRVWGVKAGFRTRDGFTVFCVWPDVEAARNQWDRNEVYNLALHLHRVVKDDNKTYYNWKCQVSEITKLSSAAVLGQSAHSPSRSNSSPAPASRGREVPAT